MSEEKASAASLPFDVYSKLPGLNATAIKAGKRSMLEMRQRVVGARQDDTPSMAWGRMVHAVVLEPAKVLSNLVVWEGGRKAGKEWTAFQESNGMKEIVTVEQRDRLEDVALAVQRNKTANRLINETIHELSVTWTDRMLGECKCRPDGLSVNVGLIEVKTTSQIEPRRFFAQFFGMGYDLQCGWYFDGVTRLSLYPPDLPVHVIAIDSSPTVDVFVTRVPQDVVNAGMAQARLIAQAYRACEAVKCWPGVDKGNDLVEFEVPGWAGGVEAVPTEEGTAGDL